MIDERAHLLLAFGRIERLGAALHGIAHAVELRAHAAIPERMQRGHRSVGRRGHERLRHDGERAADAGEPAVLREAAELDGTFARAGNFVDGMRGRRVGDVGFVGGVEEDDRLVLQRVIHPGLKLCARRGRSSRVVRRAEVNDVRLHARRLGNETVCRRAREVNHAFIRAGFVGGTGVAGHDVRIDVNGIDRVADGEFVLVSEDVEDVAAITLRSVADEDLVVGHLDALVAEIVLCDGGAEEVVALLRTVAAERRAIGHLIDGGVHGRDDRARQRFRHVADAAADEALGGFGIRVTESFHAAADLREEVASFELQVIVIQVSHNQSSIGFSVRAKIKGRTVAKS